MTRPLAVVLEVGNVLLLSLGLFTQLYGVSVLQIARGVADADRRGSEEQMQCPPPSPLPEFLWRSWMLRCHRVTSGSMNSEQYRLRITGNHGEPVTYLKPRPA